MIDTHTHLLPGVDDGVQNVEEALKILKTLSEEGVKGVCLTPHYAVMRGFFEGKAFYRERFDAFKSEAEKAGIEMQLYLGSEIDEYDEMETLVGKAHTLNGSAYALIDFGMRKADIAEIAYTLSIKGYRTVVAHPERYRYMKLSDWKRVRKDGGLLQLSAAHLIKKGSKRSQKMACDLLKEDMVDLVASDIHDERGVHDMKKAFKVVQKKMGRDTALRLFDSVPRKVLGIE